jgi:DNA-binding FadR family transcriptional regulator
LQEILISALEDHKAIFNAIREGDPEKAHLLSKQHIQRYEEDYKKQIL